MMKKGQIIAEVVSIAYDTGGDADEAMRIFTERNPGVEIDADLESALYDVVEMEFQS